MARVTNIGDVFQSIDDAVDEIKWVEKAINDIEEDIDTSDISSAVEDVKTAIENIKSELEAFNYDLVNKLNNINEFFEEVLD